MKFLLLTLLLLSKPVKEHSVTLTWIDSINPPTTTYNVYKYNGKCSPTTLFLNRINSSPIISKTYIDTNIIAGSSYCYGVSSYLNGVESEKTMGVDAVIPKP